MFNIQKLNYVYNMLEDDISRKVFDYRLEFAVNHNWHIFWIFLIIGILFWKSLRDFMKDINFQ